MVMKYLRLIVFDGNKVNIHIAVCLRLAITVNYDHFVLIHVHILWPLARRVFPNERKINSNKKNLAWKITNSASILFPLSIFVALHKSLLLCFRILTAVLSVDFGFSVFNFFFLLLIGKLIAKQNKNQLFLANAVCLMCGVRRELQ